MIIPAAMFIESAVDQLHNRGVGGVDGKVLDSQSKELVSAVGANTAEKLGVFFPPSAEFQLGYMLGLQTARVMLAGSAALAIKGVDPNDVL